MPDMNAPLSEKLLGYRMYEDESYGEPVVINTMADISTFLIENVEKYHELRITDRGDSCVFHVKEQVLLFPLSDSQGKMSPNNKWDSTMKKFVAQ